MGVRRSNPPVLQYSGRRLDSVWNILDNDPPEDGGMTNEELIKAKKAVTRPIEKFR